MVKETRANTQGILRETVKETEAKAIPLLLQEFQLLRRQNFDRMALSILGGLEKYRAFPRRQAATFVLLWLCVAGDSDRVLRDYRVS
ncbi:hypothetical protein BaRGS_00011864 [Batillaria attramentaria]|uniref:Uncharacterized protein n=1 Tax=Batillaria attramentaria TaxID=370345 RepID=A0ABD0LD29_9CAEN